MTNSKKTDTKPTDATDAQLIDEDDCTYFASPAIDQSQLKTFMHNPADWGWERLHGSGDPTPAMRFGTAFHAYLLGTSDVKAMPEDMNPRTKEARQWKEEMDAAGVITVSQQDMQLLDRMRDGIRRDTTRTRMIEEGFREQAIEWTDTRTGIRLKAKLDLIPRKSEWLVDIKTAASAQADEFAKSAWVHGYHIQAEFYRSAVTQIDPTLLDRPHRGSRGMQFWVFEKSNACDWKPYSISADSPMAGNARTSIRQALLRLRKCIDEAEAADYGTGLDAAARWCVEHGGYGKDVTEVAFADWQLREAETL